MFDIINKEELDESFKVYFYLLYGNLKNPKGYVNLPIDSEFSKDLREISRKTIMKLINGKDDIQEYNPIGSDNYVIEQFNIDDNIYMENQSDDKIILDKILNPNNSLHSGNGEDLNLYDYFIIKIIINNENIYLIRKPPKPKAVKKGNFLKKEGEFFGKIDMNKLIIFDDVIDIVVHQNIFYVFNNRALELSLGFEETFTKYVDEVLNTKEVKENIIGYLKFIEDIKANRSHIRRVAKLKDSDTKFLFLKEIDKAININKDFDLGLTFVNDKIDYKDKSQTSLLIAFMQDAYYQTLLGNEKGKDLRR